MGAIAIHEEVDQHWQKRNQNCVHICQLPRSFITKFTYVRTMEDMTHIHP